MACQKTIISLTICITLFFSCSSEKKEVENANHNLIIASQREAADSSVTNEKDKHISSSNSRDMLSEILQKHKGKAI